MRLSGATMLEVDGLYCISPETRLLGARILGVD